MEIPDYIKQLLKNPLFKDYDIKQFERLLERKFDKNLCDQESILIDDITHKCLEPLTDEDKKKAVNEMIKQIPSLTDTTTFNRNSNSLDYDISKFSPDLEMINV